MRGAITGGLFIIAVMMITIISIEGHTRASILYDCRFSSKIALESAAKNTYISSDNLKYFDRSSANAVFINKLRSNFNLNSSLIASDPNADVSKIEIVELYYYDPSNVSFPFVHNFTGGSKSFSDPTAHCVLKFYIHSFYYDYVFDYHIDVSIEELD